MAKVKHRKLPGFWRTILRYYWWQAKIRTKGAVLRAAGPKEIARHSTDYDKDGTPLRPVLQPYPWRHYVAPEDLERYAASIGGWEFEFELWPEDDHPIVQAAYDAAAEHFGPYVDSQPLDWIEAANDRAAAVLPDRITN